MRSYCQLTEGQRYQIYSLKREGLSQTAIAKNVGVHKSTVCRELVRNKGKHCYCPKQAQRVAVQRRCEAVSFKFTESDWQLIEQKMCDGWSPEQISNRLRLDGALDMSVETIYSYVRQGKHRGHGLYKFLRHKKPYRKRGKGKQGMKIPERVSIHKRDKIVEDRSRLGDWEADSVVGTKNRGAIVTLVDRLSRYTLIKATRTKKADIVADAIIKALTNHKTLTVTYDNGPEFTEHRKVRDTLKCDTYFCDPYTSQQRGTNENTNGLIREYIPKTRPLDNITQKECNQIMNKLNNRPRKCLNWLTPNEYVALQN